MPSPSSTKRHWLRFSLATFFFISLTIGTIIAGYQSGYRHGYNSGQTIRLDETQRSEVYTTVLVIGTDLNSTERAAGVADLTDLITSTVRSDIWSPQSGNEIRDFPANDSIVITAPGYAHREIRDLFMQLERMATRDSVDDLLPLLQSLASQGKTIDHVVPIAEKSGTSADAFTERYFGATVRGLSKHWGDPQFQGKCQDAGFPIWSLDQQLATWRRGKGLAYVALRTTANGKLELVSGYRASS